MNERGIAIDIYLTVGAKKVERYAFRRWPIVPRVGEFVELKKNDKLQRAEVVRVVWGEIDEREQCAVIICTWEQRQ